MSRPHADVPPPHVTIRKDSQSRCQCDECKPERVKLPTWLVITTLVIAFVAMVVFGAAIGFIVELCGGGAEVAGAASMVAAFVVTTGMWLEAMSEDE